MEARKSGPPSKACTLSDSHWTRVWLNINAITWSTDCWYYNLGITFNNVTMQYENSPGVDVRPIDFGGLSGIDYLDYALGYPITVTGYFAPLIADLEEVGYKAGVDLFGAPFDWRLADQPDMYAQLKELMENASRANGGRKVHIVAHSYGNIQTSLFLKTVPKAWVDQYFGSFISVAAPWSGAPKALRAIISGDDFGMDMGGWFSLVDPLRVRTIARQAGGLIILVPGT